MPKVKRQQTQVVQERGKSGGPLYDKSLGQHILKNPLVLGSIIEKSNLKSSDTVLEVGPGTGNLTVRILEKVKELVVVEMDPRMASELVKRVQGTELQPKLKIIVGDFLKVDLPFFNVCISNTPYQISAALVFKLLKQENVCWRVAILMFQREFALRMVAKPGTDDYCRLSANVSLLAKVDHVMKVGRNNFRPPPKVESSVVRMEPIYPRPTVDFDEWDGLLRILFTRKNKTIRAVFNTKTILAMMETNYRIVCSLQGKIIEDGFNVKESIERVLDDTEMSDKRTAKCDNHDFLKLLSAFIDAGFRFTSK